MHELANYRIFLSSMTIKQTVTITTLGLASIVGLLTTSAAPAQAATCGKAETSIIQCSQRDNGTNLKNNGIWGLLLLILNILTAGVGIVAVGGIIYGALLYTSARDDSGKVSKAKDLLLNVVLGLLAYAGMFAFLQWIIPGGIFG